MFNISTRGMVIYNVIKYLSFETVAQNTPGPIKSHKQMQQFITLQCFCEWLKTCKTRSLKIYSKILIE